MRSLWFSMTIASFIVLAMPAGTHAEMTGGVEFSRDSDEARQTGVYLGYNHSILEPGWGSEAGFRVGRLTLEDPVGDVRFRVLEGSHSSSPIAGFNLDLSIRQMDSDSWSPVLYAGTISGKLGRLWRLEVFGERGMVDTVTAARLKYIIGTTGFSLDFDLSGEVTLVGAIFRQEISDGNGRLGMIGRLFYSPSSLEGLRWQLKGRVLEHDFDGRGYFSPESLAEYLLLAGYSKPFADDNWILKGELGGGVQIIDVHGGGTEEKPVYLVEMKIRGWFTQKFGLDGTVGVSTSQSTGGSSRYVHGHITLRHTLH